MNTTLLIAACLLTSCGSLPAQLGSDQLATTTNLGGGCQSLKGTVVTGRAVLGSSFTLSFGFPAIPGSSAWGILGTVDPNAPLLCGRLHSGTGILAKIDSSNQVTYLVPNHNSLVGLSVYYQAFWFASASSPPVLTDGYKITVGNQ